LYDQRIVRDKKNKKRTQGDFRIDARGHCRPCHQSFEPPTYSLEGCRSIQAEL